MSSRQLLLLFIGSLVLWTFGNGTMQIMPVYALRLGASQVETGYYMAFAFLALAGGTVFGGWLADTLQRRKLLTIVFGAVLILLTWMMGQAGNIWQFAAAYAISGFLFGIVNTQINVLAGLFAAEKERGKIFGILGLTMAMGAIIGGLSIGPIVD